MNFDTTDPWADISFKPNNSHSFPINDENKLSSRMATNQPSNTINIFGDSAASSMVDSMLGDTDPFATSTSNNNWGDYNSFNILSSTSQHNKSTGKTLDNEITTSSTIDGLSNLAISSDINRTTEGSTKNNLNILADNIVPNNDDSDDFDNDENEEDLTRPVDIKIWSDEELKQFNPLSLKNSSDGLIVRVREIPEKEGLVFKHTNYLIIHTLNFGGEYIKPNTKGQNKNDNETKVIRRYSDFAWLVDVLWKKYPFRLIPELPPKKFASSSSSDVLFLQKRRRGLQRFLYQLCKHPVLSKENLVIMFLTVPNDFSNWKKFANIELNDEFDGIRINLPKRFKIDLTDVLKGLKDDNESDYGDADDTVNTTTTETDGNKNEFVINNINQIWNESPTKFKDKEFISNTTRLNENLSRLAEFWAKIYFFVERIEKRELALSADHQRLALTLENFIKVDNEVFSMGNLIENKSRRIDDETQNMTVINSILGQIYKYFIDSRKSKEDEMILTNNEILESWKNFQDYLISLHFLIERFFNYKTESEKETQNLLQRIIRTNEKIKQLKMKSDIRGSEIDKHINILMSTMDQLSMLISRIILVKTTFVNEFKLFQKVKYLISEIFQDWFDQRSKYSELRNDNIQRLLSDLKDMPLGN